MQGESPQISQSLYDLPRHGHNSCLDGVLPYIIAATYFGRTRCRRPGRSWWRRIIVGRVLVVWAYRLILVSVLVIVVIVVSFWLRKVWIIGAVGSVGSGRWRGGIVVLAALAALLAFAAFALGFLEEALLVFGLFACLAVLDFVAADKSVWRDAEYVFVLAEFADPEVVAGRTVVVICVFLLKLALSGGQGVFFACAAAGLGFGCWGRLLLTADGLVVCGHRILVCRRSGCSAVA